MKKLTILLMTFLLYGSVVFGQNIVNINGILYTANGTPVANIPVKIELFTIGLLPTETWNVLTDDDGRFSVTTEITFNVRLARIKVSYTDCKGKTLSQTKLWTPGVRDVTFELLYCDSNVSDSCSVEIIPGRLSNIRDSLILRLRTTGQRPITYEWSTGDTTSSIVVEPNQEYCVTITDANGCSASTCWSPPGLNCEVDIKLVITDDGNYLVADFTPESDSVSYFWSNGELGDSIKVDSVGRYCVQAVDSVNNCIAYKCFHYDPDSIDCFIAELKLSPINADSFALIIEHADSLDLNYDWSTGDSTNTILIGSSGLYSVTITDNDNELCIVELSQLVILEEDCFTEISGRRDGNVYRLFVNLGINMQPDSIVWSTGETGPSIVVRAENTAEYCVDVYIGNCIARACYTVDIDDFSNDDNRLLSRVSHTGLTDSRLFPNPVTDEVQIKIGDYIPALIQIFNNSGTLMHTMRLDTEIKYYTTTIQVQSFQPGLYFINIIGNNRSETLKFVKH